MSRLEGEHEEIRARRRNGETLQAIADDYRVSREAIRLHVQGIGPSPRVCEVCGAGFTAWRRYCSKECRDFASSHKRCDTCGKWRDAKSTYTTCETCRHEPQRQQIVQMWADGLLVREMAKRLGMTQGSMHATVGKLRKLGYDLPKRPPGGFR